MTMEGRFIPQPFGALIDTLLDNDGNWKNRELAKKTVAVIDIGFGTTDVYVSNSLSPIEKLTFSTQTAMNSAYRLIADTIEEKLGITLQLHEIETIVQQGFVKKFGKTYSINDICHYAFKSTAEKLIREINNKWKNAWEIDSIILAGGGAISLGKYFEGHFENIVKSTDSQWSIVNGYKKWAVRTWKELV